VTPKLPTDPDTSPVMVELLAQTNYKRRSVLLTLRETGDANGSFYCIFSPIEFSISEAVVRNLTLR
jgi:hypothetical protein